MATTNSWGYQNSTFPLAIYGPIDTASRKILWLKVWTSNSCPKRVGKWYLGYLYDARQIASLIRVDKGTETRVMAMMHAYVRQNHGDINAAETALYGPSTSNQVLYRSIGGSRRNNRYIFLWWQPKSISFIIFFCICYTQHLKIYAFKKQVSKSAHYLQVANVNSLLKSIHFE